MEHIMSHRQDDIVEVVREISRLENHIAKLKEQKLAIGWIKEIEMQHHFFERKLKALRRETEEMIKNRGPVHFSNDDQKKLAYYEKAVELLQEKTNGSLPNRVVRTIDDPST